MKAIICTRYGPPEVLQIGEVEKPTPGEVEVLVKIHATTVTAVDCDMRSYSKFPMWLWFPIRLGIGIRGPRKKILGSELSGVVESVGEGVRRFKQGDQVFASTGHSYGAHAEYTCMPEDGVLAKKPDNMTFEEAAGVPYGGLTAIHFLKKAKIQGGQEVLVNGAGGCVGIFAVQLARHFGAEVTGVCSTSKLDLVESLGAGKVIDYTEEDFTKTNSTYDIIFDTVGKSSFSRCKRSLRPRGIYLATIPKLSVMMQMFWTSRLSRKKAKFLASGTAPLNEMGKNLIFIKELIEAGKIRTVIDRTYPLEQIAKAHRYVEKGHKAGNVVITVGSQGR